MSFTDKELQWIQDTAKAETIEIGGVTYATKKLHDVRSKEPEQTALFVNTLDGISEYVAAHDLTAEGVLVQVVSFNRVELISVPFGRFLQRHGLVVAKDETAQFPFDTMLSAEMFNIRVLSMFAETEAHEQLLRISGNLREYNENMLEDDGFTQRAVMRKGIANLTEQTLPPFFELQPFRTFAEIDQPQSRFLFRVHKDAKAGIVCGLFEADGGRWKGTAIARIKAYVAEKLDGFNVVG